MKITNLFKTQIQCSIYIVTMACLFIFPIISKAQNTSVTVEGKITAVDGNIVQILNGKVKVDLTNARISTLTQDNASPNTITVGSRISVGGFLNPTTNAIEADRVSAQLTSEVVILGQLQKIDKVKRFVKLFNQKYFITDETRFFLDDDGSLTASTFDEFKLERDTTLSARREGNKLMVIEAVQDVNKSESPLGLVLGIVNSNDTTTVGLGGGKVKVDITDAELNVGLFNPIKPEDVRPGALFFGFSLLLGNAPTNGLKIDFASIVPDSEGRLISTLQAVDTTARTLTVIGQQINLTNNTTIMVRDGSNIKNAQLSDLKSNKPISVSVEMRAEQLIATRILQDINANLNSSDAEMTDTHLSLRSWARSLSLMAPNPSNSTK